ncbi:MAG: F0F1 ATP synthase subunit A [bacterium]|nr:F0F1 ATP synthase subunit A [bacterium]
MSPQASSQNPLSHVVPHPVMTHDAELGLLTPDGVITVLSDQIMMLILAGLVCLCLPFLVRRRRDRSEVGRMVPSGFANFVELICQYFREEVAKPHLGEHADRFIPYIWSAFFFVLTMNLLGLLPFAQISPFLPAGFHIGGTASGNIWVTGTMATLTLILMVVNGLRFGGMAYIAHFSPGPWWLAPLMIPVEILGVLAKIFALAVRLFVNMAAGHILLAVLLAMILQAGTALGPVGGVPVAIVVVVGSVAINLLEIFVCFLQAFIFTYLTTLFLGLSVNVRHQHPEEAAAH